MFVMKIHSQVSLVERMLWEGFSGILNVENEILQAAVRRRKIFFLLQGTNKAAKFA
jgi:Fe-S cluster assembly ATPase SufC